MTLTDKKRGVLANGEIDPNYLASARKAFHDLPSGGTFSNLPEPLKGSKLVMKMLDDSHEAMRFYGEVLMSGSSWYVVDDPTPPMQHAPRVEDLLQSVSIPLRSAYFIVQGNRVIPSIATEQRDGNWPMNLTGYDAELRGSPKEKIAAAREMMIHLLTHEVDEWLFKAGLVEDPHESHNELDRNELNHIFEKGAASL